MKKIFAGQKSVGYEYAFYKALRDAGLDVKSDWNKLSKKEKEKLEETLTKELSYEVPVIIDPQGRVFAVDQHHDMFALMSLLGKEANPDVPLRVLRDFSKESLSYEEFKEIVKANGWIYEKTLEDVLGNPVRITELTNSVERSVVGMAFLEIAREKDIPLKGKHFAPFVQFLLADFIVEKKFLQFSSAYHRNDVEQVITLIVKDTSVRVFLKSYLIEDAPKELKKFFED